MSILQMSITTGVLVIAVVLIRAVALNRLPKTMFLVLWGVALFRLLVPVSIPLPFSVPSIISEAINTVIPDTAVMPPVAENTGHTGDITTALTEIPGVAEIITDAVQARMSNIAPATIIWLAGMLAAFIIFAVIHYRVHRKLRFATVIRDNDYLNEWLSEHRHISPIEIMQSDRIISPLAVGIFKPRIILSKTINMNDKQLLSYVLAHEYYHIRRLDALWKLILLFALCVHWFNPLVWLMFVLASRDLELTCDEAVIRRFGAKIKKDYAYMLINMIEQGSMIAPLHNGYSKNSTEERIISIMKFKKGSLMSIVIAFALVFVMTAGALADSSNNSQADTSIFTEADITVEANIVHQLSMPLPVTNEQQAAQFEDYKEFDLTYNQATGNLYFNSELVRYFEDMIPIVMSDGQSASFGTTYFNENGTIDVWAIRDFSQVIINSDGSNNPSGRLLRLERVSQAEFIARNIDELKKQLEGNNIAYMNPTNNSDQQSNHISNSNTAVANNQGGTGRTFTELYSGIENFGVTFSGSLFNGGTGNIYYNNQLVRTLFDGYGTTLSSSERGDSIDIRVIRDDSGIITGVEIIAI